ncbi:Hint domain-containing protein [Roseovarius phycicola]|uniref:Hint domain-containing protein n=1 Tax=Roseovarius phycicola TaxID=3080976 RepID=A0ABZ2HL74_9RHOB
MAVFTLSTIYLGNYADFDPIDGNATPGDTSGLLGTYYGAGNAASANIVELTANDANSDGLIDSNDTASPDTITYDLGSGVVTTQYDSLFNVDSTVTFAPGSGEPDYNGLGGVIQTETGDLFFVMIDDDTGFGSNAFDDVAIQSITINSVTTFGSQSGATYSDDQSFVPCFTAGVTIKSPNGDVPVEHLRKGDWVTTLDNHYQRIVWIGRRNLSSQYLQNQPNLLPICISAGSLADGVPCRDLVVSPQHCLLLGSKIIQRVTGKDEVLIPAKKLLGLSGVHKVQSRLGVQYFHFALKSHELVWANGALSETLFLGPQVRSALSQGPTLEFGNVFGRSRPSEIPMMKHPARLVLRKNQRVRCLIARHQKNRMPFVPPLSSAGL